MTCAGVSQAGPERATPAPPRLGVVASSRLDRPASGRSTPGGTRCRRTRAGARPPAGSRPRRPLPVGSTDRRTGRRRHRRAARAGGPTKYCYACSSVIDSRAVDCPRCGVRQPDAAAGYGKDRRQSPPSSRCSSARSASTASTWATSRSASSTCWSFWTGIPGFIAWLEAIYFLTRSNEDWARTYGGPVQQPNGCAIGCLWALALWPLVAIVGLAIMLVLGLQIAWISIAVKPAG